MTVEESTKPKKKDWLVNICEPPVRYLIDSPIGLGYQIEYQQVENFNLVKNKPFILLPNHQRYLDIPVEGITLRQNLKRNPYYLMKSSLPFISFLEFGGGIIIGRARDIRKVPRDERKKFIERRNELYDAIIPDILSEGGIVVSHPEGTRNRGTEIKLQPGSLENLLYSQEKLGKQVDFVPLKITYHESPDKKITIKVGNPIKVPDNGVQILKEHWFASMQ